MNNYVHVWWIARDLWHHGHLPVADAGARPRRGLRVPVRLRATGPSPRCCGPLLGNWGVTLCSVLGAARLHRGDVLRVPRAAAGLVGGGGTRQPGDHRGAAVRPAVVRVGSGAAAVGDRVLAARTPARRRGRSSASARRRTPAIVLPDRWSCSSPRTSPSRPTGGACCAGTRCRSLIAVPAVVLVFASPGYADSTTRDRLVNFVATLGAAHAHHRVAGHLRAAPADGHPRARAAGPRRRARRERRVPGAAQRRRSRCGRSREPRTRSRSTRSCTRAGSCPARPTACCAVRATRKLGLYHVLRAGGRLDSEMFPESMAITASRPRPTTSSCSASARSTS